jgi:imidazolonepropionase-like amidohydrolase
MGLPLGELKTGYLADLLVVDGDPLRDVRVLQDKTRLKAIIKDGLLFKNLLDDAHVA